ncbi:retrovirus-related pol polyprotein from transposon TNT 1-94 [Tanacetum coccineum]
MLKLLQKCKLHRVCLDPEQLAFLADNEDAVIPTQATPEVQTPTTFQTDDLDAYDSDCDEAPSAQAVLMANLSSYDSAVISEVPTLDTHTGTDISNQSVQVTECYEQLSALQNPNTDITSDSNIISYEQYLQETDVQVVHGTSPNVQQDEILMFVINEMTSQVAMCNKVQQENKLVNETLTAELERYKEQIKIFEQRQKFDLTDREKYIDGQLRQVIVDRNAKVADFEKQIHLLQQQLNATVESHMTLSTTVDVLKKESKLKEDIYLDEIIDLQNKKKDLDNVVYKIGQSMQTMHMLTKPQVFYDEAHKTALGYQNPFYLAQARRKVPALYDGHTIVNTHDALFVPNSEETLILAEESRLKRLAKQNAPDMIEKKVNTKPVDYVALNKLSEHFENHFVPQKQLSAEQAFWRPVHQPVSETPLSLSKPVSTPAVTKEIPRELPQYFQQFDFGLNKEMKEMRAVFNQMEADVAQCFVDKRCFEIEKKGLTLNNERLLEHIICQDVKNIMMHANPQNVSSVHNNSLDCDNIAMETLKMENDRLMKLLISQDIVHTHVNSLAAIKVLNSMQQSFVDEYEENLKLHAELAKKDDFIEKAVYNELSKRCLRIEQRCISLENKLQQIKESFQINSQFINQDAPEFQEFFQINELQAQLEAKELSIKKLQEHIASLKRQNMVECAQTVNSSNVLSNVYKLDLEPIPPVLRHNKDAHVDYLDKMKEHTNTLRGIVEQAKELYPGVKSSTKDCGSKPRSNTRNDRIPQPLRSDKKQNKVEIHLRNAKSSLNKMNRISNSVCRNFTIDGNTCPLTRITSTSAMPPKKQTSTPVVKTVQPASSKSRNSQDKTEAGPISKSKKVATKIYNISEPMQYWGSKVSTAPSSSNVHFKSSILSYDSFCDSDLEVAFRKHTCFVRNLEGVDLLSGYRGTNLYTISMDDMLKSSPICLLSKASKTKSWLWHRRLSHLNFDTINKLAKQGLVRGLPKLKFEKDHLCSACSLGKSTKASHKPKAVDTNQEKLSLLHMDLCGPMRVASINGKNYILVIVDDYSRFTWVKFLASKDEAPELHFLWVEAVNTACFTHNRSLIRLKYNKTPYELIHDKKPDLSYLHVFGSLCYPTNDSEDLGKLKAKVDIGIFVGYAPVKKAYCIYNKRTRPIQETIHVTFDELTTMASEQFSSGPAPHLMTPTTYSLGLVPNHILQPPYVPPKKNDWDILFQPMFDEFFNPPSVCLPVPKVDAALRPVPQTGSSSSNTIDQDPPPTSNSSSQESSSNGQQYHTPFELLSRWTKNHPLTNVIGNPSRPVSTRKQLKTDAMWFYFDAFPTSIEPKNFKQALEHPL